MEPGLLRSLQKSNAKFVEDVSSALKKRQKLDSGPIGKPFRDQLFETLLRVPIRILDQFPHPDMANQWAKVELEVRLGMVHRSGRRWQPRGIRKNAELVQFETRQAENLEFRAGVDEYYAQMAKQNLLKAGFDAVKQPQQTLYFVQTHDRTFRYEKLPLAPGSTRTMVVLERKERVDTFDVAMLAHDYDVRFGIAREENAAPQSYEDYMDQWHMRRVKKRTHFHPKGGRRTWRVDYTEVTVETHDSDQTSDETNKEFEIEVELENPSLLQWLELARAHRQVMNPAGGPPPPASQQFFQHTFALCNELLQIFDCLLPCHLEDTSFCETPLTVEEDAEVLQNRLVPQLNVLNGIVRGELADVSRQRVLSDSFSDRNRSFRPEFLGAMPVNLYRRSFTSKVLEDDYLLTEKSDGVRYLLYTFNSAPNNVPQAVLLNRVPQVHHFEGADLLARCLGPGHVLDGEIVFHRELKRSLFLIFDVLCWEERCMVSLPFRERLRLVQEAIMPRYRQQMRGLLAAHLDRHQEQFKTAQLQAAAAGLPGPTPSPPRPLLLLDKEFFEKKDISRLLDRNRSAHVSAERMYRDSAVYDFMMPALPMTAQQYLLQLQQQQQHQVQQVTTFVRSCHPTDGIIFQPNRSYIFSRDYSLLKWKWADLRSIDLALTINDRELRQLAHGGVTHRQLQLVCLGPQETLVHCSQRGDTNVGLGPFDTMRLLSEAEHLHRQRHPMDWSMDGNGPGIQELLAGAIAEVAYDLRLGQWRFIKMRVDKTEPNYIDSVLGVFTEQAEAISEEELEFTLLSVAMKLEQDYEPQIKKMLAKLMLWQRNGRR